MSRRLLVVCYFYPPLGGGGVHRVLSFTRHLPRHGWECTVLCAGADDYWVKDETLVAAVPAATEVIRVPGGSGLSAWLGMAKAAGQDTTGRRSMRTFGILRRLSDWWLIPDSYVGWAGRAARAASQRLARGDIDAVLSSSPPDSAHLAARSALRRFRVPWVADFRDPWVGLTFRVPPTAWHRERQARLERAVLEAADVVTVASHLHAEQIEARPAAAGRARRVVHLPNGFEPDPAVESQTDDAHFTLVFTGTASQMPDLEVFLEAVHDVLATRSEARRRVRARIVGPYDVGYQDRATALGLNGIVEFLGPRSHGEARAWQRRADRLLLWKPRGDGYRTMVPGKLYEYLDAGRPVLALLDPGEEAAALVRQAGGTVLPPGERAPLAAAIERAYEAWKAGERPGPMRPDWLDDHTRATLAGRLGELLDGLTRESR
jgi:glycosyltransferase involved in cell wall biosynthesis